MSDNFHKIHLEEGECISEQMMFDYIDNKLSNKARHLVEKHMAGCELCSDAMEGLALVKNRKILKELDSLVDAGVKKEVKRGRVIQLWQNNKARFALAAGILLAGGIMMVVKYSMEQESARVFTDNMQQERSPEVKPPAAATSETAETAMDKDAESPVENKKEKKITPVKETPAVKENYTQAKPVIVNEKKADQEEIASREEPLAQVLGDSKDIDINAQPSSSGVAVPAESNAEQQSKAVAIRGSRVNSEIQESSKKASRPAAPPAAATGSYLAGPERINDTIGDVDYSLGIRQYRAGNFSSALTFFQKFLLRKPYNSPALFYTGLSQLNLDKTDEALTNLEKVLHGTDPNFYEAAKFYKALIYIKKNQRKKARTLLNEIINANGEYRQRASDTLKDLD